MGMYKNINYSYAHTFKNAHWNVHILGLRMDQMPGLVLGLGGRGAIQCVPHGI